MQQERAEVETYADILAAQSLGRHIFDQLSLGNATTAETLKCRLTVDLVVFASLSGYSIDRRRQSSSRSYGNQDGLNKVRWSKEQVIHQQAMRGIVYMTFGVANAFSHSYEYQSEMQRLNENNRIIANFVNNSFAVAVFNVALAAAALDGSGLNCLVAAGQVLRRLKVAQMRLIADKFGIYASRVTSQQSKPLGSDGKPKVIGKSDFTDIKNKLLDEVNDWLRKKLFVGSKKKRKVEWIENDNEDYTALLNLVHETLRLCAPPSVSDDFPESLSEQLPLDEANEMEKRRIGWIFDQDKFAGLCSEVLSIPIERLRREVMMPDYFKRAFPPLDNSGDGSTESYEQQITAQISERLGSISQRRRSVRFRTLRVIPNKGEFYELSVEDAMRGWQKDFAEDIDFLWLEGVDEERERAGVFLSYLPLQRYEEFRLENIAERLPEGYVFEFSIQHKPPLAETSGKRSLRLNYTPPESDREFFYKAKAGPIWHPPIELLQSLASGTKSAEASNHVKQCPNCQSLLALFKSKRQENRLIEGWSFAFNRQGLGVSYCAVESIEQRTQAQHSFSGLNVKIDESDGGLFFVVIWTLLEEYRSATIRICVSAAETKQFLEIRLPDAADKEGYLMAQTKFTVSETSASANKIVVAIVATDKDENAKSKN